ncbi:DUF4920 domain-containing protein [Aegicerativicinus sediminis]|uniref:DUF4920 domain-containing protein n=1 Tax=Aegicerativicinus sediminis TaxID=2893202 RepID=UPI001E5EC34B|nr:DUF4920 domain-containing protein [Aegicerativicinus sediminis]
MTYFKTIVLATLLISVVSCKSDEKEQSNEENISIEVATAESGYKSFGESISSEGALAMNNAEEKFKNLQLGDTIPMKLSAEVVKVCQAKGCWMTLNTPEGEEVMVKFKDYGFFVPKDIDGREVILDGNAFLEEVSIEDQRHLAEDAGKSEEEIAAITTPKKSFGFVANGVLVSGE